MIVPTEYRAYLTYLIFSFWALLGVIVFIRLAREAYRHRTPYSMSLWLQFAVVGAEVAVSALLLYWLSKALPQKGQ